MVMGGFRGNLNSCLLSNTMIPSTSSSPISLLASQQLFQSSRGTRVRLADDFPEIGNLLSKAIDALPYSFRGPFRLGESLVHLSKR